MGGFAFWSSWIGRDVCAATKAGLLKQLLKGIEISGTLAVEPPPFEFQRWLKFNLYIFFIIEHL